MNLAMTERTGAIPQARRGIFALAVLWAALLAFPALAVDGEVLINQAKLDAGGITPGDTAGFPATLSRAGRYKLSSNLVVPAANVAIEITASDVTVDLNGFTISSVTPGSAARGVFAGTGITRSRIAGGTIAGFNNYGILIVGSSTVIEDMRIVGNQIAFNFASALAVSSWVPSCAALATAFCLRSSARALAGPSLQTRAPCRPTRARRQRSS
jgi:hypothetical protein